MENTEYVVSSNWMTEDVIIAAERNGIEISQEQAKKWFEKYKERFLERIAEEGNEILYHMIFNTYEAEGWESEE